MSDRLLFCSECGSNFCVNVGRESPSLPCAPKISYAAPPVPAAECPLTAQRQQMLNRMLHRSAARVDAPAPAADYAELIRELRGIYRDSDTGHTLATRAADALAALAAENARLRACVEAADAMRYVMSGPVGGMDGMTESPYFAVREYDAARAAIKEADRG